MLNPFDAVAKEHMIRLGRAGCVKDMYVRIPERYVNALNLREWSEVDVAISDDHKQITITKPKKKSSIFKNI